MPLLKPKFFGILLTLIALAATGCVNLRHIAEFSEASQEGMVQYEELTPSFSGICRQDCQQEQVRKMDIRQADCACAENQKADSITRVIYATVSDYFQGLSDLSQNELTAYRTDGFTQALTAGDFGPLKLEESDVRAYSDLSTLLLRAFTDGFRRKKLQQYVVEAHGPLVKLLSLLELNLAGNLRAKLEVQKEALEGYYFDFVMDKQLSDYERTKFAEDYYARVAEIEGQQDELDAYAEVLREISDGHKTLYDNSNKMSDHKLRQELGQYGNQLQRSAISVYRMRD